LFISDYCHIRNQTLFHRGVELYKGTGTSLDSFLSETYQALKVSYPKFYKMDPLSKLGVIASEVLFSESDLRQHYKPEQVALVLANAHASLDTDVRYFESTKTMASPSLFIYTLSNIVAGEICIRNGIKGENAFFVQPAFDSKFMSQYVNQLLAETKTEMCLAGWVDVMDEHHDVFLYLTRKTETANAKEHSEESLQKLYQFNYGSVDQQS